MKNSKIKNSVNLILTIIVLISCARIGAPTGGKKDIIPPKVIKSIPKELETKVSRELNKIELFFNEYIVLNKPEEIIFTPTLTNLPIFKPNGIPTKKVVISFKDKLEENTTYLLNFGNSIVDNNEGNKLPYFNFAFTTGNAIDSLEVNGKINEVFVGKSEEKTNYVAGLFIVNNKFNDSLILRARPTYITKVDSTKFFKISNLKKNNYKLIVFNDLNTNSMYDEGTENLGFLSENINPAENKEIQINVSQFNKKYRLKELKSTAYGRLNFIFEGLTKNLKFETIGKTNNLEKLNYYSDSINYWYNPETFDTGKDIKFKVTNLDSSKIDTISCSIKKSKKPELEILFSNNFGTIDENITLSSRTPILEIIDKNIQLLKINKQDSILVPFKIMEDEINSNNKKIYFKNDWNTKYTLKILENSIKDIFGNSNKTTIFEKINFEDKKKLARVKILFNNESKLPFILFLYNERKELVKEKYTNTPYFEIENLIPGKYSVQIQIDENKDGVWNKADYLKHTQPEKTLYFENIIEARALWTIEEEITIPTIVKESVTTN